MGRKNRKYTDEFKREVIDSVLSGAKRAIQAARDYGVHPSLVHRWTHELTDGTGSGGFTDADRERQRLEAELTSRVHSYQATRHHSRPSARQHSGFSPCGVP